MGEGALGNGAIHWNHKCHREGMHVARTYDAGALCKIRTESPCSRVIKNFKTVTAGPLTTCEVLLSAGPL